MKLLSHFSDIDSGLSVSSIEEAEAVQALESSIGSSRSLMAIVQCARKRFLSKDLDTQKLVFLEEICLKYERHEREVRDHCLDYYKSSPSRRIMPEMRCRTGELVLEGRRLCSQLRETLLSTY